MVPLRFGQNHNYSLKFKLHVTNYATSNIIRHTTRHFGLDLKIVCRWIAKCGAYENQIRLQVRYCLPRHTQFRTNFVNVSIRGKRCPMRMTPLFQPADVRWMSPLKSGYFKRWNHWLIHALKAYTASDYRKSPEYAQLITLVSEDPLLIANFFDKCGIKSRNLAD